MLHNNDQNSYDNQEIIKYNSVLFKKNEVEGERVIIL